MTEHIATERPDTSGPTTNTEYRWTRPSTTSAPKPTTTLVVCHLCGQRLPHAAARCNSGPHEGPHHPANRSSARAGRLRASAVTAVHDPHGRR